MNFSSLTLLIVSSILTLVVGCATPQSNGPFPKSMAQIDTASHPVGRGSCTTSRTGAWHAEGGVVIEVQRPSQCRFDKLLLVVGNEAYPLAGVDDSFYKRKITYPATSDAYEWTASSGRLFFQINKTVSASDIKGLIEPNCASLNCLDEMAAKAAIQK